MLGVVALVWRLFPARRILGWVAGIFAAVYPAHVYMVTHIQVAVWATLLLVLACVVALGRSQNRRWRQAAFAGLLLGVLILVEPVLALAAPILALAFWRIDRSLVDVRPSHAVSLGRVAVMAGVACLAVAPWCVRNYRVHGEFVFVKSTFGYALWQGNNPLSHGTDKVPKSTVARLLEKHDGTWAGVNRAQWEARHETLYIDDILLKPSGYHDFAGLSEPARSRLLRGRAVEFISSHPGRYARLCLNRLRYFFFFDETNPKAAHWLYRSSTVIWLAFCLAGLWTLRGDWKQVWALAAIFGAVALFHVLTIVSARFRIPLEGLSFVWAAAGAISVVRCFARSQRKGGSAPDIDDVIPAAENDSNESFGAESRVIGPLRFRRRRTEETPPRRGVPLTSGRETAGDDHAADGQRAK